LAKSSFGTVCSYAVVMSREVTEAISEEGYLPVNTDINQQDNVKNNIIENSNNGKMENSLGQLGKHNSFNFS
jgi:hypothetical protein